MMIWRRWASLGVFAAAISLVPRHAGAQLAPLGGHYAGKPSDTGYMGSVNSSGGYQASVPLDLPPARGGMPVPVQIAYREHGFGAAGLGWDVPLSYILRDTTIARRRPVGTPDVAPQGREQLSLVLQGQSIDLVPTATAWVARRDAPQIEVRSAADGTMVMYDGDGRTYHFSAAGPGGAPLASGNLYLLTDITAAVGSVHVAYNLASVPLPGGIVGTSIDVASVSYNSAPSTANCYKNQVVFNYSAPGAAQSFQLFGGQMFARVDTINSVDVIARDSCGGTGLVLREYQLTYQPDADTQQLRLSFVRMAGRQGTTEGGSTIPVAHYRYGSATAFDSLTFRSLNSGNSTRTSLANATPFGQTTASSLAPEFPATVGYITSRTFLDMNGDGRPERLDGAAFTRNRPTGTPGTVNLTDTAPFTFDPLGQNYLEARSTTTTRYANFESSNDEVQWRQAIDVNGDGRVDIVDAGGQPGVWNIYLNTPDPSDPQKIVWQKRGYSVVALTQRLRDAGLWTGDARLPLARRTTFKDRLFQVCKAPRANGQWFEVDINSDPDIANCPSPTAPTQKIQCPVNGEVLPQSFIPERTITQWELTDINGDGYPDVVFNSKPVSLITVDDDPPPAEHSNFCPTYVTRTFQGALDNPALSSSPNALMVAYNVLGVHLTAEGGSAFSTPVMLRDAAPCGVGRWQSLDGSTQQMTCGMVDVNGDAMADYVEGTSVFVATASMTPGQFFTAGPLMTLPGPLALQSNDQNIACGPPATVDTVFSVAQVAGLRDMNGDGIPDYFMSNGLAAGDATDLHATVYLGTGTGFNTGISADLLGTNRQTREFALSVGLETCGGSSSNTLFGLYDLDGDGKPEILQNDTAGAFVAYHLFGRAGVLGAPEAGRLTAIDNGYGANTLITYRSAKDDPVALHQVPFPEIVVASVETIGALSFGGDIAATSYAYGGAELNFDPEADAFRFHGYRRRVQVQTPTSQSDGMAVISDTYGPTSTTDPFGVVDPSGGGFAPTTQGARYLTELRFGRPKDTTVLSGAVGHDPWALLAVDVTSDARRIGAGHYDWDARPLSSTSDPPSPDACEEMVLPYDLARSVAYATLNGADNFCSAHGFAFELNVQSWRGNPGAAPPSTANVVTRSETRDVDNFGRVLTVAQLNDLNRDDDDVCIDTTYAMPTGTNERVLTAAASRQVSNCGATIYARGTFEYDSFDVGSVSRGFQTAYNTEVRSDSGMLIRTIRDYDAGYDGVGNPTSVTKRREDGAIRVVQTTYDVFDVAPINVLTVATGVPTLAVKINRDPFTLAVTSIVDGNGTQRGTTFDGFDRPTSSTVTTPNRGPHGIMSTTAYLGFDGTDTNNGRQIRTTTFVDPVSDASAGGRTSTIFLDELSRARFTFMGLGADYSNESLVVGSRKYDGLGRVVFEADPHPESQLPATAYGTTRFFNADGTPSCFVRANGQQSTLATSPATDETSEIYPTCFQHGFQNNTEVTTVMDASSLLSGSPQFGIARSTYLSAIGRQLAASTWQGSTRLEHATFTYDQLGHQTGMTRFLGAASGTAPVTSGWHYDSLGELVELNEPGSAAQLRTYDSWGELVDSSRDAVGSCSSNPNDPQVPGNSCGAPGNADDGAPRPTNKLHVVQQYDALGRVIHSEERTNTTTDPETVADFTYDQAPLGRGRLARASTPIGSVSFSYDALGRVAQKTFIDDQSSSYFETRTYHGDGTLDTLDLQLPDTGYADELISYGYDSAGRGRTVTYDLGGNDQLLFTASTIDALGRVRQAQYGATAFAATYADTGRRLAQQASLMSLHGTRTITHQGFDPMLRERSRAEDKDGLTTTTSMTYDALGRVSSTVRTSGVNTQAEQFGYDALGNVLALTSTANGHSATTQLAYSDVDRDRICSITYSGTPVAACNVTYDEVGSIVQQPTRTGTRQLSYFVDGSVRSASDGSSSARLRYDAFGQVQDLVVTSDKSLDVRHDRRYGDLLEWREPIDGQGPEFSNLIRHIPGPSGFEASRRGNGGPWVFQFGEARGNRFFTDENGVFVQDADYTAYGEPLPPVPGSAGPRNVMYSNEQWNGGDSLAALGLHHLGARLYDPVIGRFLSRDPLLIPRSAATTNPYAFAMNDPVNVSDPTGLDSCAENPCPSPPVLPCLGDASQCVHMLGEMGTAFGKASLDALNAIANAPGDLANAIGDLFSGGDDYVPLDPTAARGLYRVTSLSWTFSPVTPWDSAVVWQQTIGPQLERLSDTTDDVLDTVQRTIAQAVWVATGSIETVTGCLMSSGCTTPFDSSNNPGAQGDYDGKGGGVPPMPPLPPVPGGPRLGGGPAAGEAGGERAGKPFTPAGKAQVKAENAEAHAGQTTCVNCGQSTVPAQQSRAGVTPPGNETHVDHIIPRSKGGNGAPNNGQVLCRGCNLRKGARE